MGAKDTRNVKLGRTSTRRVYRCEYCGRPYITLENLRTHESVVHATALKEKEKKITLKSNGARKPVIGKTVNKPQIVTISKIRPRKMPLEKERSKSPVNEPKPKKSGSKSVDEKKIEFQCPKCDKMYPVYFSALRHIQKLHCVNSEGEKVASDSPDIIKPIRTELCIVCKERVPSTENHDCTKNMQNLDLSLVYSCTGCDQKFTNLKLFDIHVPTVHHDGVESMFFPSNKEFLNWKQQLEMQTKTKYLVMGKYNFKHIYRCSSSSSDDEDDTTIKFCPSMIVYQEFPKGIQIHFYKHHSGHTHKGYVLSDKYKTYCITDMLQQAESYAMTDVASDDNDLYMQFKTLMESIVLDAAKLNIATLKSLIGKALDMTSVLTNYDEDNDFVPTVNTSMLSLSVNKDEKATNNQITKALEGLRTSQRLKRKISEDIDSNLPVKKLRNKPVQNVEPKSPILQKCLNKPKVNTFSLADNKDDEKILHELDNDKEKGEQKTPNLNRRKQTLYKIPEVVPVSPKTNQTKDKLGVTFGQSPTSFNDSYKDFVQKQVKTSVEKKVKTAPDRDTKLKTVPDRDTKLKTAPDRDTKLKTAPGRDTTLKTVPDRDRKKKQVVKTKVGQFRPSISPKKKEEEPVRKSLGKLENVKYEVKERENDCNILILKI